MFASPRAQRALAITLICAGVLLLIAQVAGAAIGLIWPFFIILPGVALLIVAGGGHWPVPILAVGAVMIMLGVILLVQNYFGYFQSWAYVWALLPLVAGAVLAYTARKRADEVTALWGRRLLVASAATFVVFLAAFEGLVFGDNLPWGRYLLPLALVAAGIVIYFISRNRAENRRNR